MFKSTNVKHALAVAAFLAVPGVLADSISPVTASATIAEGDSITIHKTVTVSAGAPTSSKVDVFFLADTTGSMGTAINSVKTQASTLLSSIAGLGDVAFGVGEYKDFGDSYVYRLNQNITTSQASAQTGINLWLAAGGGDTPEANLYGLTQVANTSAWRPGSARIVVWFGDAPGHDPSGGATLSSTISALNTVGAKVEAVNVGNLNGTGQATAIATATGGHYYVGSSSGIVSIIQNAITTAFATYNTVGLDLSEVPAGLSATVLPGSYTGTFDRSTTRTFDFDVTLTGDDAGTYDFNIYGTVNGGRVATETDHIVVTGASPPGVPDSGSTLMLMGAACSALGLLRRKR